MGQFIECQYKIRSMCKDIINEDFEQEEMYAS